MNKDNEEYVPMPKYGGGYVTYYSALCHLRKVARNNKKYVSTICTKADGTIVLLTVGPRGGVKERKIDYSR